jgi:hypothetical protein
VGSRELATTPNSDTLRGLRALFVVTDINAEAEAYGLCAEELKAGVENRLAGAGLEVLRPDELFQTTGYPVFGVCVTALRLDAFPDGWAYAITVDLEEYVMLARDECRKVFASVWHAGTVGTAPGTSLAKLYNQIMDTIEEFVSDYNAANGGAASGIGTKPDLSDQQARYDAKGM